VIVPQVQGNKIPKYIRVTEKENMIFNKLKTAYLKLRHPVVHVTIS